MQVAVISILITRINNATSYRELKPAIIYPENKMSKPDYFNTYVC